MSEFSSIELWLVALAITIIVLGGFGAFARWCSFSSAVPRKKLEQLHVGMTVEEVVALLGEPREKKQSDNASQQWLYGARMKRHILILEFASSGRLQTFAHGVPDPRRAANTDA